MINLNGRIQNKVNINSVISKPTHFHGVIVDTCSVKGKVQRVERLNGIINESCNIHGILNKSNNLKGTATYSVSHGDIIIYDGNYDITPNAKVQKLSTKYKKLMDNVIVRATPFSEVSNEAGGYTITIL